MNRVTDKDLANKLDIKASEGLKLTKENNNSEQALNKAVMLAKYKAFAFGKGELVKICTGINEALACDLLPIGINPVSAMSESGINYKLPSHMIVKGKIEMKKINVEKIRKMNSSNKKISTLIIDDDIDSLLPVDSIFRKYGCQTEQAMNYLDALQKIKSTNADIIVLDWRIGDLNGGDLIEQCANAISANEYLRSKFTKKPIKIVTYSGDDLTNLRFSEKANKFFNYLGQWNKQKMFSEIEASAVQLMVS